ncbi:MAG: U32 family peptidase [Bacilli bacterium]|nr:U32 family peptidase [Bacilli bacterium]
MKSNILIYVESLEYIEDYRKAGVSAFLFALEDYSVGYKTFSLEEIKKCDVSNKYLLLNRILDCKAIDELKNIFKNIDGVKGIVYEDIGVYNLIKELNLDIELVHFQNHFGTNLGSVNFWLDRVDSIFISNENTKEEILNIVSKAKKEVCLHLYGYNQAMYSRRLLLSNWSQEFNIEYKNSNLLSDVATGVKFRAIENEYGTVMYSENVFNGKDIYGLDNVKFYYVNTMMIPHYQVMDFLTNIDRDFIAGEDDGFLNKETIFKLKGRDR